MRKKKLKIDKTSKIGELKLKPLKKYRPRNKKRLPVITCYTDGSYSIDTDTGGFCAYLEHGGKSLIVSGHEYKTTVNRMEIRAVLEALKIITVPCLFLIHSDSMYVVNTIEKNWIKNWISNGWKTFTGTAVANQDLWRDIYELLQFHTVKMIWVKGHSGIDGNELCDEVAQMHMRALGSIIK